MRVKLVWRRDRFLRGGDQISFLEQGWAGVRFTEPNEDFDHQHQDVRVEDGKQFGDLIQFVDFRYLARVTRVVGSSLSALARAPRAPAKARIITANLSYDTELRWDANPESDIAGYEVVWRDSTEALWTHSRQVGKVTGYTIEGLNKDDNQVGVRAIDSKGNRSPVAFPIPANECYAAAMQRTASARAAERARRRRRLRAQRAGRWRRSYWRSRRSRSPSCAPAAEPAPQARASGADPERDARAPAAARRGPRPSLPSAAPRRGGCGSRSSCTTSSRAPPAGTRNPALWVPEQRFASRCARCGAPATQAITLRQAYAGWHKGAGLPKKPVVVSFDDGYLSHYTHARPVLRALGWPGCSTSRCTTWAPAASRPARSRRCSPPAGSSTRTRSPTPT